MNGKVLIIKQNSLLNDYRKYIILIAVRLFEYDSRFKIFGADFIQYDYKFPLDVPRNMSSQFDLVIADPPFLSEECLTKSAVTIKFLTKRNIVLCTGVCTKLSFCLKFSCYELHTNKIIISCTGAIMAELAERLLDVRKCDFIPGHKNNLANEFYCYSNFNFDKNLK